GSHRGLTMSTPASAVAADAIIPPQRMRVNVKLNVRAFAGTSATLIKRVEPGTVLTVDTALQGESFHGQRLWYRLSGDEGCGWSGGLIPDDVPAAVPPDGPSSGPRVDTRPDGSIRPLSPTKIGAVFGVFASKPAKKPGFIAVEHEWIDRNIVSLEVPAL